jgi:hypothetical protein
LYAACVIDEIDQRLLQPRVHLHSVTSSWGQLPADRRREISNSLGEWTMSSSWALVLPDWRLRRHCGRAA